MSHASDEDDASAMPQQPAVSAAVLPAAAKDTLAPDNSTVHERAGRIIADGKITLDAQLRVFTVDGTNEPRVVRLLPRESCSCDLAW